MKPSEILREARSILFERGWHKGSLYGPDGSVCAMGAIDAVGMNLFQDECSDTDSSDLDRADRALRLAVDGDRISIWNDAHERTFDEVIEAFDRAEKIAELEETTPKERA